jgi:hydroxypyruvate isomerase
MFNEVAFPQRFAAAAAAGFKAVEFLFPYDHSPQEVAIWLKENGLENVLFNLPPGDWAAGERGIAALPGREDEFRAGVARGIKYALALGTKRVHMMAGLIPAGADMRVHREVYLGNLRYAAAEVGKHGISLLIEPINGRDMPGYFLNDFNRAISFISDLNHTNVKLQFDIYHRQIIHGDVLVGLERAMPVIGHVQTASVPRRNEPGTGELDDFRIFAALDGLGYKGYVGCEYRPADATVAGLGWLKQR